MADPTEGREALIHFNVPAGSKARWVKQAQREGKKLTAWIIEKLEDQHMNAFKIPESLASHYHGAGWAIAAIAGGKVVALRYIEDVAPLAVADAVAQGGSHARFFVDQWIKTTEALPVVRELQALGQISLGMLSSWEFVEL